MSKLLQHQLLQSLSQKDARITQRERRLARQLLSQFPRTREQFIRRQHFVHYAHLLSAPRRKCLTGQQKVAPTVDTQYQGPNYVHPVARDESVREMGRILK